MKFFYIYKSTTSTLDRRDTKRTAPNKLSFREEKLPVAQSNNSARFQATEKNIFWGFWKHLGQVSIFLIGRANAGFRSSAASEGIYF